MEANRQLSNDEEAVLQAIIEAMKNPKANIAVIAFSPYEAPEGMRAHKTLYMRGGLGLIDTLYTHACVLNDTPRVLNYINTLRSVLNLAERQITEHNRNSAINN